MNPQQLTEAQQKFFEFQKNLTETVVSPNNEITISFNGLLEVTSLVIDPSLQQEAVTPLLISAFNRGIKNTSQKIQAAVQELQKQMLPPSNK